MGQQQVTSQKYKNKNQIHADQQESQQLNKFDNDEKIQTFLEGHKFSITKNKPLGEGSFGKVYQAFSQQFNCNVAIKFLKCNDSDKLQEYQNEVHTLEALKGQRYILNILKSIHDEQEGIYCIVTELCDSSLKDMVKKKGFSESQVYAITLQLLKGLAEFDYKQIIHFDIKPDNILYSKEKNEFMIADCGLAKILRDPSKLQTQISKVGGTALYSAPEVWKNQKLFTTKADTFSLGQIFLELIHERELTFHEASKIRKKSQNIIKKVFPNLYNSKYKLYIDKILIKMLKKKPEDRESVQKLIRDLETYFKPLKGDWISLLPEGEKEPLTIDLSPITTIEPIQVEKQKQLTFFSAIEFYKEFFQVKQMTDIIQFSQSNVINVIKAIGIISIIFLIVQEILIFSYKMKVDLAVMLFIQIILLLVDLCYNIFNNKFNVIITLISVWLEFWTVLATNIDDGFSLVTYDVYWGLRFIYQAFMFIVRYYKHQSLKLENPEIITTVVGIVQLFNVILTRYTQLTDLKVFVFIQLTFYQACILGLAPTKQLNTPLQISEQRLLMQIMQSFSCLFPFLAFSTDLADSPDYILASQFVLYEIILNLIFWITVYNQQSELIIGVFAELFTDFLPILLPWIMQQSPDSIRNLCISLIVIHAIKKFIYLVISSIMYYREKKQNDNSQIIRFRNIIIAIYKIVGIILIIVMLQQSIKNNYTMGMYYSIVYLIIEIIISAITMLTIWFNSKN